MIDRTVGFIFRLGTTTRLSATNYLLINAGESMDQRQIEKAPDCNRTRPNMDETGVLLSVLSSLKVFRRETGLSDGY